VMSDAVVVMMFLSLLNGGDAGGVPGRIEAG